MITKLFKGKKAEPIEKLRLAVAANEQADQWREKFWAEAKSREDGFQAASDGFAADPNDSTAAAFLAAWRVNQEQVAFGKMANLSLPELQRRALERTREPLREALTFLISQMEAEVSEIRKRDATTATELGVDPSETASPLIQRVNAKLNEAQAFLRSLDSAKDIGALGKVIAFCLE